MNKEVNIAFKVEGLDGYITNLDELNDALNKVDESTKDVSKSSDELGKAGKKSTGFFNTIKTKGVGAFKALKGAIAATGVGLLITAIAALVDWFKNTDAGIKVIQGSTAALGVVFNKISDLLTPLGEKLGKLFSDPKQALLDFGTAIKDNIISRFEGILKFIPSMADAIGNLFKGNFKEAGKIAFDAVAQVTTGVEGASDKIGEFAEDVAETVAEVVEEVKVAVKSSNDLVDAQNRLRASQRENTVETAKLNQELETQQKIADDTTRSYDERKAALDRVNAANEELAANAVRLAEEEKAVLEQQLALAATEEERREIRDQLAEAEANLIDAQTQQQIVRLESAQLNRELDQEELERLQEIEDQKAELAEEEAKRKEEARKAELKAIEEQNAAILAAEEALQSAKANAYKAGLGLAQALAGENEKLQNAIFLVDKAVAAGKVVVDAVKAKAANLAYAATLGPAGPVYLTAANQAVNINTAAGLAAIAATTIAKFKGSGGGGGSQEQTTAPLPSPSASINYSFGQQAGQTIGAGQSSSGQQAPVQTYVLASDVTSAQQAQQQIQNLSRL